MRREQALQCEAYREEVVIAVHEELVLLHDRRTAHGVEVHTHCGWVGGAGQSKAGRGVSSTNRPRDAALAHLSSRLAELFRP